MKDFVPEGTAYLLEQTILRSVGKFPVVVLLGTRAVGKTTLLRRLFSKTHNYVPLERADIYTEQTPDCLTLPE
ncbi:MAG: AAA family ATPase [Sedimentisphaerales bacterium]